MPPHAVTRWARLAAEAHRRYHIPTRILLGEIEIESAGIPGRVSSAQARGITQFIPSTARAEHVDTRPGHERSQVFGQARYLAQLKRQHGGSLTAALQAYSGGSSSYPGMVRARAQNYVRVAKRANAGLGPGGGGGGAQGGSRGTRGIPGIPGTPGVTTRQSPVPGSTAMADLLRQQLEAEQAARQPVATPLSPPSHSASYALHIAGAVGGAQLASAGAPAPPTSDVGDLIAKLAAAEAAQPGVQHSAVPGVAGVPGTPGRRGSSGGATTGPGGLPHGARHLKGVAHFEGTPVAAWIKPWLVYARKHGWRGVVKSGYRSNAEQRQLYAGLLAGTRSGPVAKPGTSNHEGANFPRGAVDVTEQAQLSRILRRAGAPLVWAGSKDLPHFSHPHNGSY